MARNGLLATQEYNVMSITMTITRSLGFSLIIAAAAPGCRDRDRNTAPASGPRIVEASASLTPGASAIEPMGTGPGDQDTTGMATDAGVGRGDGGMRGGDGGVGGGGSDGGLGGGGSDGGLPAPGPDRSRDRGGSGAGSGSGGTGSGATGGAPRH
jgi:hypothetical protein